MLGTVSRSARSAPSRSAAAGPAKGGGSRSGRASGFGTSTASVSFVGASNPGDVLELQRSAGNQAVVQLLQATAVQRAPVIAGDVDPRARVDVLQRAIVLELVNVRFAIKFDEVAAALDGLTAEDGRAIKTEYQRRTGYVLPWVLTGRQQFGESGLVMSNSLGSPERTRLLNLLGGTAIRAPDPERAVEAGEAFGGLVAGAARLLGKDDIADELGERAAATAAAQVVADQARETNEAEDNRHRVEAAQIRRLIEGGSGEAAIAMVRRPDVERQAMATQYKALYGQELYIDLTTRLKGAFAARAAATWIGDTVLADQIALEADLANERKVEADAADLEQLTNGFFTPASTQMAAKAIVQQRRREARGHVEARLVGIAEAGEQDTGEGRAAGREHLAEVLKGPGSTDVTLGAQVQGLGDRGAEAIVARGEPEELAARLARADVEGSLKAADLEAAIRQLRVLARRMAISEIERQPALATQAESVLRAITDGYYQRFQKRFDSDDTKRTLDKALALGNDAEEERNRALLAEQGSLPAWRELDLAMRQSPRDMDRIKGILLARDRSAVQALAAEYHAHTGRTLETDLLGTPAQQLFAEFRDQNEARQEHIEQLVLLQGGRFHSDAPDEASQLEQERQWLGGRTFALKRAVMQNRGTFATARDWVGNIEEDLVERADRDSEDASIAASRALTQSPPDVDAARDALAGMRRAADRLERNLDVYKEATKAAFDEFVDLAVLAITTIVTLGEGSAVILAIRATVATVGTKLVLKGNDYGADEFLMDLRSGLGAALGGKLAEGVLKPVATKVAAYAAEAGLASSLTGKVAGYAGKAANWEAENVLTTGVTNIATGQDIGTGLDAAGHARALAQHGVTSTLKAMRPGGRNGHTTEEGEAAAARPVGEGGDARVTDAEPRGEDGQHPREAASGVTREDTTVVDAVDGEVMGVPHMSMALPEPGRPAVEEGTRRPSTSGAEHAETPPETGAMADADDWAADTREDIPIAETDRQRHNREQQEARARRNPSNAASLRESTAPGARSRAFAREMAPIFADWPELHPVERLARLETVMNGPLAAAGSPRVLVEMSADLAPGSASFDVTTWKVTVSEALVTNRDLSPEQFASLADNIAHEGRHALHHFRGLRVAEAEGLPTTSAELQPAERAVRAAEEANAGTRASEPMDVEAPAFQEARDVFQQTFGPGAEHRLAVKQTLASANRKRAAAQAAVDGSAAGSVERAAAEQILTDAQRKATEAHNDYMALPQETDAWRRGQATQAAMLQELQAQQVRSAWQARGRAAAEVRRARRAVAAAEVSGGDTRRAQARLDDALAGDRAAKEQLDVARRELQELQDATQGATLRAREHARERARIRARRGAGAST